MTGSKARPASLAAAGLLGRVAGAPITWGVCEVPGWGHQMAAERVLAEIRGVGFAATELGPKGFLPEDGPGLAAVLARHGLRVVAGFVPALLHVPGRLEAELEAVDASARALSAAGAEVLVLAASTGRESYEAGASLSDSEWTAIGHALSRADEIAARHGLLLTLHPHYGTAIEGAADVARLLEVSSVGLCLDIGHLMVAGADALAVARSAPQRVRHVHLKDVDAALALRVQRRELGYHEAVRAGLYRPLGEGGGRVAELVRLLESQGYSGWYVLEQDAVLHEEPPPGGGPAADAARSLEFLRGLAA